MTTELKTEQNDEITPLVYAPILVVNMLWGFFMFSLAVPFAKKATLHFHSEILLTILQAGLGICLAIIGLMRSRAKSQKTYLFASSTTLALLFISVSYVLNQWPGDYGDGGLRWGLYMGPSSMLSLIVCLFTALMGMENKVENNSQP